MISFFVPGIPVPQGRARSFKLGDGIGHYDDPKSKAWKGVVAKVAGLQRNRWHEGPLKATLVFFLPIPKKTSSVIWPFEKTRGMGDSDNYAKACLDAMNGIIYKDDIQVCRLDVEKQYANNVNTGVRITIEGLE
jgi:Holliday junction resolvase RusA-like endonuclease